MISQTSGDKDLAKWKHRRLKSFVKEFNIPPKSPLLNNPSQANANEMKQFITKVRESQNEIRGDMSSKNSSPAKKINIALRRVSVRLTDKEIFKNTLSTFTPTHFTGKEKLKSSVSKDS